MKIGFDEISTSSNRYAIVDLAWFPVEELPRLAPVEAEIVLTKKDITKVELSGRLQTAVELVCDRCLVGWPFLVDVSVHLILHCPPDFGAWQIQNLECSKSDLDTVMIREPVVDLGDILRQQLFLSLPHKRLCRSDCRGLCSGCGVDLNQEACRCDAKNFNSPFAILAGLNKIQ